MGEIPLRLGRGRHPGVAVWRREQGAARMHQALAIVVVVQILFLLEKLNPFFLG